jgi:hypothetical protein
VSPVSNVGFLTAAHVLTWTALALFVVYLVRRRKRAIEHLDETASPTGGGHS